MTLDTRVYVTDEVPVDELFVFCQTLIGEYDSDRRGPDRQESKNEQDSSYVEGEGWAVRDGNPWTYENIVGQGLPAWLMIHHGNGKAYRTPEQSAEHDYCNHPDTDYFDDEHPLCTKTEHQPPCWAEISMDTAYGYRGPDDMGCGDLHAILVSRIGQWCDARSVGWKWENEYSGEIHEGYERLVDLVADGFAGTAWFTTMVLPAIASGLLNEGGQ